MKPIAHHAFPPLRHLNAANAVTSLSVALGCAGVLLALRGAAPYAVMCGIGAIACDVADGAIARRLGQRSTFGATLDSLADAVSFCLLPAALGVAMGYDGSIALALPLAYAMSGLWRLAHFSEVGIDTDGERPAFRGMPTPYAAAVLFLLATLTLKLNGAVTFWLFGIGMGASGLAMLAGFRFRKGGPHYWLMWVSLPLAALALAWH